MTEAVTSANVAGQVERVYGISLEDNPYRAGSLEWFSWVEGWHGANQRMAVSQPHGLWSWLKRLWRKL